MDILRPTFDFEAAVAETAELGYFFGDNALSDDAREKLQNEINQVPLEVGDHIAKPINQNKPNEVRQQHERFYVEYGTPQTPVANMVIDGLVKAVSRFKGFPELNEWLPNEIGYQRYRHSNDFIGAHRDRSSDQLLSTTFTIAGSAIVRTFDPEGDYWDYSNLKQRDEYITSSGGIMLLRAPGLGNGGQVIHQVLPPSTDSRSILNLRMRPTVLRQPSKN